MNDEPLVFDVRVEGDPSFSFLPKLSSGDWAKLQAFYGMEIERDEVAGKGELYWRLYAFELKSGPAVFQPQVWKNGQKYVATPGDEANVAVAFHWPDAPAIQQGWQPRWQERAVIGWTEGRGDVGFGYSSSAFATDGDFAKPVDYPIPDVDLSDYLGGYGAASVEQLQAQAVDGGPFWIWVMAGGGKMGSDAAAKLNWVDNHLTPNPIFQITEKGGSPIPDGEYRLVNRVGGQDVGYLVFQPDQPSGDTLVLLRDNDEVGYLGWL